MRPVLDPCSGSRMFYFNKHDPRVVFGDNRQEEHTLCDGRKLEVNPDVKLLVVFDPPHLVKIGSNAYMALKYGKLSEQTWQEDIRQGFSECFRVLKKNSTLIFKWNETQIPLKEILALTPYKPVAGHISGKRSNTHWVCFLKE